MILKVIFGGYYFQFYHYLDVFLTAIQSYNLILYNISIRLLEIFIYISSFFNKKAALWIEGRKKFPDCNFRKKTIWMHCASLGEFEQGRPVIELMKKEWPDYPIVVSFFSPSGYEVKKKYSGADKVIYLPSDTPYNSRKIIEQINPALVIWVKYEYWLNCLNELKKQKIPVLLIAGIFRTNQPFFKWYGGLFKKALSNFEHIFSQNKQSAELLKKIGYNNITIAGDTRFDRVIEIAEYSEGLALLDEFKKNNKLIIAGSTWLKDEQLFIKFSTENPAVKIIIVPHEIHQSNLKRLSSSFKNAVLFSDWIKQKTERNVSVLIVDSIGLLSTLYRYADIAYIGGGFNKGIHNTLEAAVYGKPVVFGPNYNKFEEAKDLIKNKGAFTISNFLELNTVLSALLNDNVKNEYSGDQSKQYVYEKKGATQTIVNYIKLNRLLTN